MIQVSIKTNSKKLRQACVDFIQSLFYENVATKDFDVKAVIDYCYTQDMTDFMETNENVLELLTFADKYGFQTLKVSCLNSV